MNTHQTVNRARAICLRLLVTCWMSALAMEFARGAEGTWAGTTEVAYVTDYLWRGAKLAGDSIIPLVSATYSDRLYLAVSGTYGLKKDSPLDPTGKGKYGETDYLGSYTFLQDAYSLTVGGQVYAIDDLADPKTGTAFKYYFESVASFTLKAKFSPTLTYWREYGRLKTNYLEFSLSESFEIDKESRLNVRPYAGFYENSQRYFGVDVSASHEFGNQVYGRATATFVHNNAPISRHDRVNFGVALGRRW